MSTNKVRFLFFLFLVAIIHFYRHPPLLIPPLFCVMLRCAEGYGQEERRGEDDQTRTNVNDGVTRMERTTGRGQPDKDDGVTRMQRR